MSYSFGQTRRINLDFPSISLNIYKLGQLAPFSRSFIIRGIGYRAQLLVNNWNFENYKDINTNEFPNTRYLSIRAGYSFHLCLPIPNYLGVLISKKERKLTIYGSDKSQVSVYSNMVFKIRPPSVYTGRGIRFKKFLHKRKVGKKDVRKGRYF